MRRCAPGVDAVVKKLRVGEISTAIIEKRLWVQRRAARGAFVRIALPRLERLVKAWPQTPNWEITDHGLEDRGGAVTVVESVTPLARACRIDS